VRNEKRRGSPMRIRVRPRCRIARVIPATRTHRARLSCCVAPEDREPARTEATALREGTRLACAGERSGRSIVWAGAGSRSLPPSTFAFGDARKIGSAFSRSWRCRRGVVRVSRCLASRSGRLVVARCSGATADLRSPFAHRGKKFFRFVAEKG